MTTFIKQSMRLVPPALLLIGFCLAFTAGESSSGLLPQVSAQSTGSSSSAGYPRVVLIIRHAEKPPKSDNSIDLTTAGFERAKALPGLFLGDSPRFPRPDALFATHISAHSNRPAETITPLAYMLDLPLNTDFVEADVKPLADKVLSGAYAGKVVLICWHHETIPALAEAFGVESAPEWPGDVFNRVWKIDWVSGKPRLTILQQDLMPGDPAN